MSAWTKEPWGGRSRLVDSTAGREMAVIPMADYTRARECVNACAGIACPGAKIAELRSAIGEALELLTDYDVYESDGMPVADAEKLRRIRKALGDGEVSA